jgi:hypothetical protein
MRPLRETVTRQRREPMFYANLLESYRSKRDSAQLVQHEEQFKYLFALKISSSKSGQVVIYPNRAKEYLSVAANHIQCR